MVIYNYNLYQDTLGLINGTIRFNISLNNYPTISVTEWGENLQLKDLGHTVTFMNMPFYCTSSSLRVLPPGVKVTDKFVNEVTSEYTHSVQKIFEKKIIKNRKLDGASAAYSSTTGTTYTLNSILGSVAGAGASVAPLGDGMTVKVDKDEEEEETTLKDIYEPKLKIAQKIWAFNGGRLSFKKLRTGLVYADNDFTSDIEISHSAVPTYKNTKLTWKQEPVNTNAVPGKKIIRADDETYYVYEGDYNPHVRPPFNEIPKDLSANSDMGGITKEFKITVYKFGQPDYEVSGVFGFANAAIELVGNPEASNTSSEQYLNAISGDTSSSGNAQQELAQQLIGNQAGFPTFNFAQQMTWRLIKCSRKNFIYEPIPLNLNNAYVKNEDGTKTKVTIPESHRGFISRLNIEALIAEETSGWELRRFSSEDAKDWRNNGSIPAWLSLKRAIDLGQTLLENDPQRYYWMVYIEKCKLEQYLWRKIPTYERTNYYVGSYGDYYKDAGKIDWQVEWVPRNSLPEFADTEDDTEIPVLYPDINWQPELMMIAKTKIASSIGTIGNPEFNPLAPTHYETNPSTITTGSETYEHTAYGILPSKNTKPEISKLSQARVNVDALLATAASHQGYRGTMYSQHAYVGTEDYGIKGFTPPNVAFTYDGDLHNLSSNSVDRMTTYVTLKTSQGEGIKNNRTTTQFTTSQGRPPSISVRKPNFSEVVNEEALTPPTKGTYAEITSNIKNPGNQYVDSISASGADSLGEAIKVAIFELEMAQINASGGSATLSLERTPDTINLGSICGCQVMLPEAPGVAIIKGASFEVQVTDGNPFMQPIQVDLAAYQPVTLTNTNLVKENKEDKGNIGDDKGSVELLLSVSMGDFEHYDMIPPVQYSRWG